MLTGSQSIQVLEYWISHSSGEPDTKRTEWREEYDAKGQLVMRTSYSDEQGFKYERFTYDVVGRLVKVEQRVSAQDTRFESAKLWPEYSCSLDYFTRTDGEPGVYRIATDFNGKPFQLDRERELASGWEYMYDPDLGEPTTLRIEYEAGKLSIVTRDFGDGDKETLSYQYGAENRISKTIQTALGSSSPLFTTEYAYDGQGRLTKASTWDHRTNKQGRIRTFSDYDERGNWKRVVTRLGGEIDSIVVRDLRYR